MTVAEFETQRGRLFGLAYRLIGSAEEAEDVVQDAFLRWNGVDQHEIERPSAWLAKVVTNLSLNRLTSARARRERYVGPWLPEPVAASSGDLGPLETAEQRDSVSFAMLVLLERLTPTERAVFVLREAFGHSYAEIADVLSLTEPNCRQLHRRAGQRLAESRPRFSPDADQRRRLVERFLAAAEEGDVDGLTELLTADVVSWSDGGGKVRAGRRPVYGRDKVIRLYRGMYRKYLTDVQVTIEEVNGDPAVAGWYGGKLLGVLLPEFGDGRIQALRAVANPDKLRYLEGQLRHE
ncbi:RNA polymerase sigma-70 factor [Amycolatopsis nigrescens]|uniref:RNA polymerase sigma-70 factor n=1 Tax=Amycolatopsis nigrescens TaxID=381445 RepID=UPI00036C71A9|nr:RNA polymerase sigma-70 factor [Amycolatopsis nigrescens]